MNKDYNIQLQLTYTVNVWVEAEDWEEAYDIANQRYHDGDYDDEIVSTIQNDSPSDCDIFVRTTY